MTRLLFCCAASLPLLLACDTRTAPDSERVADLDDEAIDAPIDAPPAAAPIREAAAPNVAAHPARAVGAEATMVPAQALATLQRDDRPTRGGDDAKLQIVVFSDFECPYCARLVPSLEAALETYGDDVSLTFKQKPLPFHPSAEAAARASLAAHAQGEFWAMHDALFDDPARVRAGDFEAIAAEIGLDTAQFARDLADPSIAAAVARDLEDADALGIRGTPSMVIGDRLVVGAQPLPSILAAIDAELAEG